MSYTDMAWYSQWVGFIKIITSVWKWYWLYWETNWNSRKGNLGKIRIVVEIIVTLN
jgi:hypothetical protein